MAIYNYFQPAFIWTYLQLCEMPRFGATAVFIYCNFQFFGQICHLGVLGVKDLNLCILRQIVLKFPFFRSFNLNILIFQYQQITNFNSILSRRSSRPENKMSMFGTLASFPFQLTKSWTNPSLNLPWPPCSWPAWAPSPCSSQCTAWSFRSPLGLGNEGCNINIRPAYL